MIPVALSERGDVRIHLVVLDDPAFGGEDGRERNRELATVAAGVAHAAVADDVAPCNQTRSMVCAIAAMLVKKEALISKTASFPLTGGLLPSWNVTDGERNSSRHRASRVSTAW
jgi:hypothetical protein